MNRLFKFAKEVKCYMESDSTLSENEEVNKKGLQRTLFTDEVDAVGGGVVVVEPEVAVIRR